LKSKLQKLAQRSVDRIHAMFFVFHGPPNRAAFSQNGSLGYNTKTREIARRG